MKKLFLTLLPLLIALVCLSAFVSCVIMPPDQNDDDVTQDIASEGLAFELNEEETGYILVGMGDCTETAVIVPAEYDGLPVLTIAAYAFSPQSSNAAKELVSVTIPEGVVTIEEKAFYSCPELTTVKVPSTLEKYMTSCIFDCEEITYNISDMVSYLGNDENPYLVLVKANVKDRESYTIHEDTEIISMAAFEDCKKVTALSLPDGIRYIGTAAFAGCEKLESINLPDALTEIGGRAFSGCEVLADVQLPENVKTLGDGVFVNTAISSMKLPDGIEEIPAYTFSECSNLKSFTIPVSVKKIGDLAFEKTGLTRIDIPSSVTKIGAGAFEHCYYLETVTLRQGLQSIGNRAFSSCRDLAVISLPKGLTSIGNEAFGYCGELSTVSIPGTLTTWGEEIFCYCTIEKLTLGEGITTFDRYAFDNTSKIGVMELPSSFVSADWKFTDMVETVKLTSSITKLTASSVPQSIQSIHIPTSVTSITWDTFAECKNLATITIDAANTAYYVSNNTLIEKSTRTVVRGTATSTFGASDNILIIGKAAFKYVDIKSVTLPNLVKTVSEYAFYDCEKLDYFCFSSGVRKVESNAFNKISSITFESKDTSSALLSNVVFATDWYVDAGYWLEYINCLGDNKEVNINNLKH